MKTYEEILKFICYPTVNRLFELEGSELTDFVIRGAAHIVSHGLNLRGIDSTGLNFSKVDDRESVVKLYSKFEFVKDKDIEDIVDLGDFIKVKVIEQRMNISTSKVLYVEISKKLIK